MTKKDESYLAPLNEELEGGEGQDKPKVKPRVMLSKEDLFEKLNDGRLTIDPDLAAQILEISPGSVYRAIKEGTLPALEFGRLKKIPVARFKEMLGV